MKRLKAPLLFALAMAPIGAVAGYFTILYQMEMFDGATLALVLEQFGSREALIAVYILQTVVYACFCGFFGHILAGKLGLWKPWKPERDGVRTACLWGLGAGIVLALDHWTFGAVIPGIQEANAASLSLNMVVCSVLYGGIVEELMLRLFFMSLIAWLIRKLFFRKRECCPEGVVSAANVIAALVFAAGHLPATVMLLGELTPLTVFRCFLLNGGFGLVFGRMYRKYGIGYAMACHALAHIVSKTIWLIFL